MRTKATGAPPLACEAEFGHSGHLLLCGLFIGPQGRHCRFSDRSLRKPRFRQSNAGELAGEPGSMSGVAQMGVLQSPASSSPCPDGTFMLDRYPLVGLTGGIAEGKADGT
jgi:hypothetical protein